MRLLVLLLCTVPLLGQADYFPLHVGNQWVYRSTGTSAGESLVLKVIRREEFDGRSYSLLRGLRADHWLRGDGMAVYEYDSAQKQERLWYRFDAPAGEMFSSAASLCCGLAMIHTRETEYDGPLGEFKNALEISFPGVFQVGTARELFLPYIGMVHKLESTGGPLVAAHDLIYARIGEVTVVGEKHISFGLSIDRPVYEPGDMMTVRLTIRNTHDEPIALRFPSGQIYDIAVKGENGEVVYQWSLERGFTQALQAINVGGEQNWVELVPIGNVPAGKYVAESWLTTFPPQSFRARLGFEIK